MKAWWDEKFDNHKDYMASYGEGVGSHTRHIIFSYINKDESLLDAGCGPGWNYEHGRTMEDWHGEYKGTDYSVKFIGACKEKWPEGNFEVQDARDMTEPNGSWDVVLLQDIVEHTNGYELPMYEALRIAKKKVIVTFWRSLMDRDEDDVKLSDEGLDGYGASYSKPKLFEFLDNLKLRWEYREDNTNRHHEFIIIYKEKA